MNFCLLCTNGYNCSSCVIGSYLNADGTKCLTCTYGFEDCESGTACRTCNSGYILIQVIYAVSVAHIVNYARVSVSVPSGC